MNAKVDCKKIGTMIPIQMYQKLRLLAIESDKHIYEIIIDAIEKYLEVKK